METSMFKRFSTNYMAVLLLIDIAIIQSALWLGVKLRALLPYGVDPHPEYNPNGFYEPSWGLSLVIGLLWVISFVTSSVYTPRKIVKWFDETQRIILAHTISALSLAGLLYFANIELPRLTYVYFYSLALPALLGYRSLLRTWHRFRRSSSKSVARILIVGAGKLGQDLVAEFYRQQWPGIEIIGFLDDSADKFGREINNLPVLGKLDDAARIIEQSNIDEVIITLPAHAHSRLANLVAAIHELPVRVRVVPDYFGLAFFGASVESLGGIPLIGLRDPAIDDLQRLAKRLFDMTTSAVGLLLISPILALVALAIKLEDNGPVFYLANRVGENGRLFKMIKFRSMKVNADKIQPQINQFDAKGQLIHKIAGDPRVTRVGRFIRRTSIDELPQLLNVLKGEMSLVGPRPELPWLVANYQPWQRKRFAVPQGMTGWWQVNGRSDNAMHLNTEQDLYYIQNYSLWLDFQILFRTVTTVLRGKGAY